MKVYTHLIITFIVAVCSIFATEFSPKALKEGTLPSSRQCLYPAKIKRGAPYLSASFLFWQAKQGQMEYAAKNIRPDTPVTGVKNLNLEIITPDFSWNSGAKVLFGYQLPSDGLDIQARWTYSKGGFTNIKKRVFSEINIPGEGVIPLWFFQFLRGINNSSNPRYKESNGDWKLRLNAIDLEWGRYFFIYPELKLRLSAGVKIPWLRQTYKVEYITGNSVSTADNTFELVNSDFVLKNNNAGIGPRIGVNSRWNLCWGFSLIGDGSLSLVYNYFGVNRDQTDLIFNQNSGSLDSHFSKLSDSFGKIQPILELTLGLDWGYCLSIRNRENYLGFSIGYDIQYWWGQNQMRRVISSTFFGDNFNNIGDLQLQGLTASARFDF